MTGKKRAAAGLLAVLIAAVLLSSVLFLAVESDHDCAGDGCPVCARIVACENTLRLLSHTAAAAAVAAAAVCFFLCPVPLRAANGSADTPVSLKVKLLN